MAFVGLGLVVTALVACGGGDPAPNLSTVPAGSSAPGSSGAASSAAVPASPSPVYPADVPLTGHNVRPGEKPPIYPAAASARTQAGANAFAEFFMKTLDWAYATTNPSYMKHYYGPTCGQCSGLATGIAKTATAGHSYEGGRITETSVVPTSIEPVTAPAEYCSVVTVNVSTTSVVDAKGNVANGSAAARGLRFKLCAVSDHARWQTTYLSRL